MTVKCKVQSVFNLVKINDHSQNRTPNTAKLMKSYSGTRNFDHCSNLDGMN